MALASRQNTLVIEADKPGSQYWQDLWRFRELIYFMAWRDILVRYKQAVLGVAWSLIRPILAIAVLYFVFKKRTSGPTIHYFYDGADREVPYLILAYSGLLFWQFFADSMTACANSLVLAQNVISKVFFPRLITPASRVAVSFVDLGLSLVVFLGLLVFYYFSAHFVPSWRMVFLPGVLIMAWAFAMGCGLWLAALNVKYRDVTYIVPFMVQLGLFVSPVGWWSGARAPDPHAMQVHSHIIYSINPMMGIIELSRWCIFGPDSNPYWPSVWIALGLIAFFMYTGLAYFRKTERTMADVI